MLGFGLGAVAPLTPYALAIARPVVQLLIEELGKNMQERSKERIVNWVRHLFGRREGMAEAERGEPSAQALTPEQLSRVRQLAFEKSRELDLPERDATLLADAMVGSLVVGSS